MVRQLFQASLGRGTKAVSQVVTKKHCSPQTCFCPASLRFLGNRDRHIGEGGSVEGVTFSLHCFLLLAKSSILLDTGTKASRKVGAGSV